MNSMKSMHVNWGLVMVASLMATLSISTTSTADLFRVTVYSTVEWNQIRDGSWSGVQPGDEATVTFLVDSEDYVNDDSVPTRGYPIVQDSFEISIGGNAVGYPNPYPYGETPYFVLRDNDPAVDGFFLSNNTSWPWGNYVDEAGRVDEYFKVVYEISYTGSTLESLNIEDAVGFYYFGGLQSYYHGITDGGFDALGLLWQGMDIEAEISAGPTLEVTGECPGEMTFVVNGATAAGRLAFAWGLQSGSTAVPPCPGLSVDIANARLAGVVLADENGTGSLTGFVPQAGCGRVLVQAVDLASCQTTNVVMP